MKKREKKPHEVGKRDLNDRTPLKIILNESQVRRLLEQIKSEIIK
jgi:hypothetical protein